jgi:hypothetical protein
MENKREAHENIGGNSREREKIMYKGTKEKSSKKQRNIKSLKEK